LGDEVIGTLTKTLNEKKEISICSCDHCLSAIGARCTVLKNFLTVRADIVTRAGEL